MYVVEIGSPGVERKSYRPAGVISDIRSVCVCVHVF